MFQTLRNAWKIPDLRKKILYTILMLVIFRLGSFIPVPGINGEMIKEMMGGFGEGIQGLINNFSGGALERASIFSMSITPYINSSIILQLLTVAIPALERLAKEGEEGRKKIASYTRYLTVVLAFVQATGLYFGLSSAMSSTGVFEYLVVTFTFTAGTAFLMWLGEQITERGIGNGISLLIVIGIVSRAPDAIQSIAIMFEAGISVAAVAKVAVILVIALVAIAFVVLFNQAERKIPVQYAKRVVGRKTYGGQSSHIPVKVIMAGVMPIIFAVSIMSFPRTISMFIHGANGPEVGSIWATVLRWFSESHPFYIVCYFLLILFFTYFYTAIQFNPIEVSNNIKRNNGSVPGIRPGKPTSDYIAKVLSKTTLLGAFFLGIIAIFPLILAIVMPDMSGISIGGTSLLIVVGVSLETVKNIESQMLMRHYKGFLE